MKTQSNIAHSFPINPTFESQMTQVDGWLLLEEARILNALASTCTRGAIVEIGSWKGKSTCWMAKDAKVPVYAIDPHTGSEEHREAMGEVRTFADFKRNLSSVGLLQRVTPILKRSDEAVGDVHEPIELLFIDGDHSYEGVKQDFELWAPKVLVGGTVAFHDTTGWAGPKRLMKELTGLKSLSEFRRVKSITYMKKVQQNTVAERLSNSLRISVWNTLENGKKVIRPLLRKH